MENAGKKARLTQQKAHEMLNQLKSEDVAKLKKGKPVTVKAVVEVKGNQVELVSISSL